MRLLILTLTLALSLPALIAKSYYVSANGDNTKPGLSEKGAWKNFSPISKINLQPGDEIILRGKENIKGELLLKGVKGTAEKPILIRSTPGAMTPIAGRGEVAALRLVNCNHIHVSHLTLTANGGVQKEAAGERQKIRCGALVYADAPGDYSDILFESIDIHHVYLLKPGSHRAQNEVKTANGTQGYGWGIRVINRQEGATIKDITIRNCRVSLVSHTGVKFTSKQQGGISNVNFHHNAVSATGGPGVQLGGVKDGHFSNNKIDGSGDASDPRHWGRGSGLWTWNCDRILIEKNQFLNAHGPGDSAGCHIDFNCRNVIVQYNFSMNNAGGFCEILGNNHNCAYRYNVSVNDGYRIKGKKGAFQEGKIFWLSGYRGRHKEKTGPYNSYFYNNTIFTSKKILAKFSVSKTTRGILIINNIFHIEGASKQVMGDQNKSAANRHKKVKRVVFENNLYLRQSNWPKGVPIRDSAPVYGQASFIKPGGDVVADYTPRNRKLIQDKSQPVTPIPGDSRGLYLGLKMKVDILGNPIKGLPDFGAIEMQ